MLSFVSYSCSSDGIYFDFSGHFLGNVGFSLRQPAVVDVEVGIEDGLALLAEKGGWALIHSLGFCCFGIGQQTGFQVADHVGMLIGDVVLLAGVLRKIVEFGLAGQQRDLTSFQLPLRTAPRNASTLIRMSSCGDGFPRPASASVLAVEGVVRVALAARQRKSVGITSTMCSGSLTTAGLICPAS